MPAHLGSLIYSLYAFDLGQNLALLSSQTAPPFSLYHMFLTHRLLFSVASVLKFCFAGLRLSDLNAVSTSQPTARLLYSLV